MTDKITMANSLEKFMKPFEGIPELIAEMRRVGTMERVAKESEAAAAGAWKAVQAERDALETDKAAHDAEKAAGKAEIADLKAKAKQRLDAATEEAARIREAVNVEVTALKAEATAELAGLKEQIKTERGKLADIQMLAGQAEQRKAQAEATISKLVAKLG